MFLSLEGVKVLEDCPTQLLIPSYLLGGGIIGALEGRCVSLLLYDSTRMRRLLSKAVLIDDDDEDDYPWRQNAHKYCIHLGLGPFLRFTLGNYWVFSVYLPSFIPPIQQPQACCERSLCLFAVGVLGLSHPVLAMLILGNGYVYVCARWRLAASED
uniref:transmembrane protein 272 n=1 Tax=Jaculus jaculus TaxID=51337 RepID=UPI001E1B267D|nr:transmembrane protein 272 [Jaculus jaculus]